MTRQYIPMHPRLGREPIHREGWVYEEKIGGWRMLAYKDGRKVRLESPTALTTRGAFRISSLPWPRCRGGRSC